MHVDMHGKAIRLVVIEDEEAARSSLRLLLQRDFPEVELLGMADGVAAGLALIERVRPDVILLDIQLKDGLGFELADRLGDTRTWIIFTTAHSEYALRAFRYLSLAYLLKPIDAMELRQAFRKIETVTSHTRAQLREAIEMVAQRKFERIALHDAGGIQLVALEEIVHCQSFKNYTDIFLLDGRKITVSRTLKYYEELLPADRFMRIHQQHLVQLKHLVAYRSEDGGFAVMVDGTQLEVSKRKKRALLDWLAHP